LGTIGLDNEVDRQTVSGPRLRRSDDGHRCSSGPDQTRGPLPDVAADDGCASWFVPMMSMRPLRNEGVGNGAEPSTVIAPEARVAQLKLVPRQEEK
jgi:hypothetical protein